MPQEKNAADIGLVKKSSTENFSSLPLPFLSGYFPQEVTPLNLYATNLRLRQ